MSASQDWLNRQKEAWANAKTATPVDSIPDGKYKAHLTGAFFGFSRNDRPQVTWVYTLIEGEYAGEKVRAYDGLDKGEESLTWLAKRIHQLGFNPIDMDISRLNEDLDAMVAACPVVTVRLKTNGDFQNLHIDTFHGHQNLTSPAPSEPAYSEPSQDPETSEEEPEEEVVAEEESPANGLVIGAKVSFLWKNEAMNGVVTELGETKAKVRAGNKLYPVAYSAITNVDSSLDD